MASSISVFVPIFYVIAVFGGLYVFSSWYRKRAAGKLTEPYFPSHPDRDIYVTLLGRSDPPTSDTLLKSALIRRAMADVQRVLKIREDKPALQNLLQKGSVGDDLWNSLLAAEKELEAEIMEVVNEANSFVEGWGTVIFQTANEMIANEKIRGAFERTSELRQEMEAKYGKSKTLTEALLPPPQLVANNLNALSQAPAPNGSAVTPSTPLSPSTPTKSSGKKGKK